MSNTKTNLKSAKEAIGAKKFDEALKYCQRVLDWEPDNYNALVFLGLAHENLDAPIDAVNAYRKAIDTNKSQPLAWQGLAKFYEKKENWSELADTLEQMLTIHQDMGDAKRLLDAINKLVDLYTNKQRDRTKAIEKLMLLLPSSPYFTLLSSTDAQLPLPLETWLEIARLHEVENAETITREIEARRWRLNARPLPMIKEQVQNEVYSASQLGEAYEHILAFSKDNPSSTADVLDVQRKYLEFLQKKLAFSKEKDNLRERLYTLARSLVDRSIDSPTPYEIIIESTDSGSPDEYDQQLLALYISKFPDTGLSKFIRGHKLYTEEGNVEQALDLFADGLDQNPSSLFGYQAFSWLYHDQRLYEVGLEYATKGRELVLQNAAETGQLLEQVLFSMEFCMASCYQNLDPKYYPDAMAIYTKILGKYPDNKQALEGSGLILTAQKKYDEAIRRFERVLELDKLNHTAKAELGSIECELGHYDQALEYLTQAIEMWGKSAVYYLRLGKVYWAIGGDHITDRSYAYTQFIQAVKLDPHYADAFTYLGHYYRIVEKDRSRAKKCYQKAFSLDPSDVDTGVQLSDYYIEDNEMELAEMVFRTVTKVTPRAGWAWKRLGFTELAKESYLDAITDFQTALRTDAKDIHCWEGLAEAYQHEGRYIASMKAFLRAKELNPTSVHTNYQIAIVRHKLGLLDEAVDQFRLTLNIARDNGTPDYLPVLKGLAETHLAQAKQNFQLGFYGRAADACGQVLEVMHQAIRVDPNVQCFWKLVGDACLAYRVVSNFVRLCPLDVLKDIVNVAVEQGDLDAKLHFPPDACADLVRQFLAIDMAGQDLAASLPTKETLNVLISCSTIVYKCALILSGNDPEVAPVYWYDLGIAYFAMRENNFEGSIVLSGDNNGITPSNMHLATAIRCVKAALKFEPSNIAFWNTLGVMATSISPKISQHALIKAIELNPRNAIPWSNLGYLYLSRSDLELSNQAFSMSQSLDPDWIPAWVGQACVAMLWGSKEGNELFEHAFDTSGGALASFFFSTRAVSFHPYTSNIPNLPTCDLHQLEADYGYASITFNQASTSTANSVGGLLVSPAFALQKYTEQRPDDPTALNLLGLVSERLEQYDRAAEAFAGAILSLESKLEQGITTVDSVQPRLASVHANLARVLCAAGDFAGSIASYTVSLEMTADKATDAFRVYCHLGAGIAYYFHGQLNESVQMFSMALGETETEGDAAVDSHELEDVRKDAVVLLSQVLWALGDKVLAEQHLFECIAKYPTHLPAIFSLCVMGLVQDDATLTTAALRELTKLPAELADELDKDGHIDLLFSRFFQLQGSESMAIRSFTKSIHQMPTNAASWSRLARQLTTQVTSPKSSPAVSVSAAALSLLSSSEDALSVAKAKAYQNLAAALLKQHVQESARKTKRMNVEAEPVDLRKQAVVAAQRAVMTAPWDMDGWTVLAVARRVAKDEDVAAD